MVRHSGGASGVQLVRGLTLIPRLLTFPRTVLQQASTVVVRLDLSSARALTEVFPEDMAQLPRVGDMADAMRARLEYNSQRIATR